MKYLYRLYVCRRNEWGRRRKVSAFVRLVDGDNSSIVPWKRRNIISLIVYRMESNCAKRRKNYDVKTLCHVTFKKTGFQDVGYFITVRNEVTKVMFLQVSVCTQGGGGGVCLSTCWDTPPEQTPWEQTPPRSRHPPRADRHPPEQTPPTGDPPGADTPPADTHQEQIPPPEQKPPPR